LTEQTSVDEDLSGPEGGERDNTESEVCTNPSDEENFVADFKVTIARKDSELNESRVRIHEMEQVITDKEQEIARLIQSEADFKNRLSEAHGTLSDAVAGYRNMVLQANPEVVTELINGDSIEAVNESLAKAKDLVGRVRKNLESEIADERFPMGVPERRIKDASALSARDKIRFAIGGKT